MAVWSRFQSILFGGAIGAAARTAIEPQIEPARQEAWRNNTNRILDLPELGMLLAQGLVDERQALDHAKRNGYDGEKLHALAQLAMHAPDVQAAMHMWRLGETDFAGVQHALRKAGIEPRWDAAFRSQKTLPLTPADLANAVQQGFVPNANLLPDDPGGVLPITPPVDEIPLQTLDEFAAGAVDGDHAKVLSQLVGLPPGPVELLDMWNRGVITERAVEHGVREGHTKTKWTSALKELRHFLLSPADAAGLRLRGWIDDDEMNRLGALRGASPTVMHRLYLNRGRPATAHQVFIGLRRGGSYDGPTAGIPSAFVRSIEQSDIRPEWTNLLWAGRFTYPSAFVLRALTQAGDLTVAETQQILHNIGWPEDLATTVPERWAGTAGGAAAPWTNRARGRLYTVAHNEFLADAIDEPTARGKLAAIGIGAAEVDTIINLWVEESQISRLELTPAQIRKAYKKGIYTYDEAFGDLEQRGMTPADADTFLQSG